MSASTAALSAGLKKASGMLHSFSAAAGKALGSKFAGTKAAAGARSIGEAFRNAAGEARVLKKAGLLDMGQRMRILGNLAGDIGNPFKGMGKGIGTFGMQMAGATLKAGKFAFSLAKGVAGAAMSAGKQLYKLGNYAFQRVQIGAAVGAFGMYKMVTASADLNEAVNFSNVMFGDYSKEVVAQADLMSKAFGTSKTEFVQNAAALGGMFEGAGYTKKQAADLSIHFLKLAQDASSIANIPLEEALVRIKSGLAGEMEAVRRFGVNLSEANVQLEAQRMGLKKVDGEYTQEQKLQVRSKLLTEGLAYAHGDMAKTADEAANSIRGFWGRLEALGQTIGDALMPLFGRLMNEAGVAIQAMTLWWKDNQAAIMGVNTTTASSAQDQVGSIGYIQKAIGYVADAWQDVKIYALMAWQAINQAISNTLKTLAQFLATAADAAKFVGLTKMADTGYAAASGTEMASLDAQYRADEAKKSIDKGLAAPRAHEEVDAYFARARQQIAGARKELGAQPTVDPSMAPGAAKAPPPKLGTHEVKYASAAAVGSKDYAESVLKARFGAAAGGKDANKETAKNTSISNQHLSAIAKGIGQLVGTKVASDAPAWAALAQNF